LWPLSGLIEAPIRGRAGSRRASNDLRSYAKVDGLAFSQAAVLAANARTLRAEHAVDQGSATVAEQRIVDWNRHPRVYGLGEVDDFGDLASRRIHLEGRPV